MWTIHTVLWYHNVDHTYSTMISQCGPYIQHSDITMWTIHTQYSDITMWTIHTVLLISQCGPYIHVLWYHNVDHTYSTLISQCGPYIQYSDITMWTIHTVLWYHNVDHTYSTLISQCGPYIQYSDITMWTIHTVLWYHNVDQAYSWILPKSNVRHVVELSLIQILYFCHSLPQLWSVWYSDCFFEYCLYVQINLLHVIFVWYSLL